MIPAPPVRLTTSRPLTFDDLETIPDDLYRYEVHGGSLVAWASPGGLHQQTLQELLILLDDAVKAAGVGEVLPGPFSVEFTRHNIVLPDLIFIHKDQRRQLTNRRFLGAPCLLVEVSVPESAHSDFVTKVALYMDGGVGEYWIADPRKRRFFIYRPAGETTTVECVTSGTATSTIVPGFAVDLDQFFAELSFFLTIDRGEKPAISG